MEAELEEARKETVTWVHRAETFKAERYQEFAHLIDLAPPPPPQAIEWAILVRQPEFWGGVVGLVTLLAAVYAIGAVMGGGQHLADRAGNGLSKLATLLWCTFGLQDTNKPSQKTVLILTLLFAASSPLTSQSWRSEKIALSPKELLLNMNRLTPTSYNQQTQLQ